MQGDITGVSRLKICNPQSPRQHYTRDAQHPQ